MFFLCLVLNVNIVFGEAKTDEPVYINKQHLHSILGAEWRLSKKVYPERLKGVKDLIVVVDAYMKRELRESPLGQQFDTIRSEIAKVLTDKLVKAGLPVVSYDQWKESSAGAVLHFYYDFSGSSNTLHVSCKDIYVLQRNPQFYEYLPAWRDENSFNGKTLLSNDTQTTQTIMFETAQGLLDDFIQQYQQANPETDSRIQTISQYPSVAEMEGITEFMKSGGDLGLEGLTCFVPAIGIRAGRSSGKSSKNDQYSAMTEKIIKKYELLLRKAQIPVTTVSQWEKNPIKALLCIDMLMLDDLGMFTATLYDRYILKRNPTQVEYRSKWSYGVHMDKRINPSGKVTVFLSSQSGRGFRDFVRAYRKANPLEENSESKQVQKY